MSSLLFRNRQLFALVIFLMAAASASAFLTIRQQEDPTITNIYASITTTFPGADPARVETLVTQKIESDLRAIAEIDDIVSVSRIGVSIVQIKLSQYLTRPEIEEAWAKIRDALDGAARSFPDGVLTPKFENDRASSFSSIVALVPHHGTKPNVTIMHRYAKMLQSQLRNVSGTKYVDLYGARDEEIQVSVRAKQLASMGLTIDQVSDAIVRADAKVQAGQVRGDSNDLLIEVSGELQTMARVSEVPIFEGADGRIVRVGDIATVKRGVQEPGNTLAIVDGKEAILVASATKDNIDLNAWSEAVEHSYANFRDQLPAALNLRELFDQADYTSRRLNSVVINMIIGIIIVVGVLYFTLGLRAAIVIGLTIPFATSLSIAGLQLVGVPIHQMSITGLIVALGLLVDAAIVINDDLDRRLHAGTDRLKAIEEAVQRLALPLLASTVTTILTFMPMVLLPGPTGEFVSSIAISVIIMLTVSFVMALSVTPVLAAWMFNDRKELTADRHALAEEIGTYLTVTIRSAIIMALLKPKRAMAAALVLPLLGLLSYPLLKPQFFPGVDRNQFHIQLKMAEGSAIKETRQHVEQATDVILKEPDVTNVTWVIGENAPAFYYNMIANQSNEPGFAEALVTTKSPAATEAMLDRLQRRLSSTITEARITVRGLVQGPPVEAPVEIRLVGQNVEVLRELGEKIRKVMLMVPGIVQATPQLSPGAPKLFIDLQEEKVKLAGLDLGSAARQLEALTEGVTGGSVVEGGEELPVRVRASLEAHSTIDKVLTLDLLGADARKKAAAGEYPGIPLTALGKVSVRPAQTPIYRLNGERINTVQGFVERDALPEVVLDKVLEEVKAAGISMPEGYRMELGGDADARQETMQNLAGSAGFLLSLAIVTIVLTLGSYRLAAITMVVAVLSFGLSVLSLAVFGYPFGIQAVIGSIGSIGVSINAAIILMTALQSSPRAASGDIIQMTNVTMAQSRHIVSTTLTTFGGFLPLILEGGGFWPPFAMSIAGGVLLSTVISFFFVPPAYLLFASSQGSPADEAGEGEPHLEQQTATSAV